MLLIGWGTLAAQAGLSLGEVPCTSQEHLDRLAQAAREIVVFSDEREELHLVGPGPIWAFMAIAAALRTSSADSKPWPLVSRIAPSCASFEKDVRNA